MNYPLVRMDQPLVGPHYQPMMGEVLWFTGTAWWRPVMMTQQYMTAGMSSGAKVALVICGLLFFWPALLFLIGSGPKLAVRQMPTGQWQLVSGPHPDQVAMFAELQKAIES